MKKFVKNSLFWLAMFSTPVVLMSANQYVNNVQYTSSVLADDPAPVIIQPTITIPKELAGDVGSFVEVVATTNGDQVKWAILNQQGLNLFPIDLLKDSKTAVAVANKEGIYYLHAWTALNNIPSDLVTCKITIGTPPAPIPVPPQPIPPQPIPPTPVPSTNLSVLFVDEKNDYGTSAYKPYLATLNSTAVRAYLNAHTAKVNGVQEWRRWDKDTDVSNESAKWQSLFSSAKSSGTVLPAVLIADSTGKQLFLGPVPGSIADTLALLQKYGG